MFREKSVYEPLTPDEGTRVLVMRKWPRGVGTGRIDVWLKDLGPPTSMLDALADRSLSWLAFEEAYLRYIQEDPAARAALDLARELEQRSGLVTLFCHERLPPCHRFVLLRYLSA